MQCKNHPDVVAEARCAACQEAFCSNCLVDMGGKKYCGSCKVVAVRGAPVVEEATLPCKEAGEALTYALIGIVCFGIILEPMALVKAAKARKMLALNPRLTEGGKVTAAQIIAAVALILWVLGIIARISQAARM